MSHVCNSYRRFLVSVMLAGVLAALLSFAEVHAQAMQPNMNQMPGMGDAKQGTTATPLELLPPSTWRIGRSPSIMAPYRKLNG